MPLNEIIKESHNKEAEAIKVNIDGLKKERSSMIFKVKDLRRRISYKEAELTATMKLLEMKKSSGSFDTKKIGYLKHQKRRLEFKISTEASSLSEEKELVMKINQLDAELDEAFALVRLERKVQLMKSDIERYTADLAKYNSDIADKDAKIDALYTDLRKVLKLGRWQNKRKVERQAHKEKPMQEINLEDIAVIKRKPAK
ncbi:MAG: hypothetical protein M1360_03900 [Candidatus Marsarchaeota archaeon]|nr:hypothetical protein [Candidatus Marsarchaeota archaeon]MCL5419054.1 hypothetical protein [Candidatus Marsarchaeota archaeon]